MVDGLTVDGLTGAAATFEFATAARIVFGPGSAARLPAIVQSLGSRVLVCTGSSGDRYQGLLGELGMPVEVVTVHGEPTVDAARAGAQRCADTGADVVLAIGGGSVLDMGKAVAMLATNGGDPLDYLEVIGRGQPITRPSLPVVAVPTTAGSGAEVTANAVLAAPREQRKASLRAPSMLPAVALLDPLLTLTCGPSVTTSSGLDALTQCLEPFVSPFATPMTDLYAADGLRRAARALPRLHADPDDVDARTDMALASLFGGLALANAKLGAVHGLAGVLGGRLPIAHGAICAALLAPVTERNVQALRNLDPESPALGRYRAAAQLLTGSPTADIEDGLAFIRDLVRLLGIPALTDQGIDGNPDDLESIAAMAATSSSMRGNPVTLSVDELRGCLAGD